MEILPTFLYIILFLSTLLFNFFPKKVKRKLKRRAKLPPGSMGWPYLGETLQLYSQNPTNFFIAKEKRYGEIFKSHVLGCPAIMLATPDAIWFVLVSHAHLFKPTYPKSKERLIGPSALFFHTGDYHTRIRKIVHGTLSPEAIKKLLHHIEATAMSSLNSWATGGQLINTFQEMKKFSFEVGVLAIFGHLDEKYKENLKENYFIVDKGYNSFPSNLPGTPYRKAVSARRQLDRVLSEMINDRKQKRILENDLLGHLLNFKDEKGQTLTEKQIADNIIGILFAAQDTTASALTWILKYLHDDQNLLEAVKEEQKTLYETNARGNQHLTWDRIKKMTLTYRVILESLRMSSIISFTFREATEDVEYKGYLIPKGWKVMPLFRNIHHNPKFFADPQNFSPSRFEAAPKPNTFMPFGNGVHACPGNELAKLEMLILIHHLITKYRWEVPGSQNGIEYGPFPIPEHGLPARFWKDSNIMQNTKQIEDVQHQS
ncbi:abscisic acid 8'-hydroxylase 4 [Impatiens glandulifera]|uniref:abscisic acid 8'-hydroxylase 4 n=1 Tax=Impatiens glandulifera TaxID=253017 RepID=UPI001FB1606F|nr:abscisic acid 8'-hydroxylase 4 [Impatiens glandulifera]